MEPELKSFSPSLARPDSETLNFTLSLKGKRLIEGADIYLVEKGRDEPRFRHVSASYGEDDETAEVVFSGIAQGSYDIVVVNPGGLSTRGKGPKVGEPRAANEDRFSLDGQKLWSIGPRGGYLFIIESEEDGVEELGGSGFIGGIRYTFYEKFKDRGKFFILPNVFFAEADFLYTHKKWDEGPGEVTENFTGGEFRLGALYKVRLSPNQRWLINFGVSLGVIAGSLESDGPDVMGDADWKEFVLGLDLELNSGIEFRFTPAWSLDLSASVRGSGTSRTKYTGEGGFIYALGVNYTVPYK
jgi:hypothetical protein